MKVWNYVILTTGLILLLQLAGIETGAQGLLSAVGLGTEEASVSVSSIFDYLFNSLTGILVLGAIVSGVVIGFFTRSSPENFIILPIIGTHLVLFVSSLVSITNYAIANSPIWVASIVIMILGTLTIGYIIALVEFFRGTD